MSNLAAFLVRSLKSADRLFRRGMMSFDDLNTAASSAWSLADSWGVRSEVERALTETQLRHLRRHDPKE